MPAASLLDSAVLAVPAPAPGAFARAMRVPESTTRSTRLTTTRAAVAAAEAAVGVAVDAAVRVRLFISPTHARDSAGRRPVPCLGPQGSGTGGGRRRRGTQGRKHGRRAVASVASAASREEAAKERRSRREEATTRGEERRESERRRQRQRRTSASSTGADESTPGQVDVKAEAAIESSSGRLPRISLRCFGRLTAFQTQPAQKRGDQPRARARSACCRAQEGLSSRIAEPSPRSARWVAKPRRAEAEEIFKVITAAYETERKQPVVLDDVATIEWAVPTGVLADRDEQHPRSGDTREPLHLLISTLEGRRVEDIL